jgi:hypothetical protein
MIDFWIKRLYKDISKKKVIFIGSMPEIPDSGEYHRYIVMVC